MADIELSCGLPPGPDFADLAVLAESLGYARVWIFDSAPLWEDPFAHLALAASRTTRIGLATAVLIPSQRSVMAMASGIATIVRLSGNRFRACFGTGNTAHATLGQPPMPLSALFDYVGSLRRVLAGETVVLDGKPVRMLHWPGMSAPRPVQAPLWLSVLGPRGNERAHEVADGVIGPPHPKLPSATMIAGTVLDEGEDPRSTRVLRAVGPWGVAVWHTAYHYGGAAAVDALPGGAAWRASLEALGPAEERHLLAFEGHATHLSERDVSLLEHLDLNSRISNVLALKVGGPSVMRQTIGRLAAAGHQEVMYTPSGPDVARELEAFARIGN
ncbi:LLM class flavin-dependent oxidoreductase [Mycobacterium conspicuum]|jgi:5,10-methylenetetrahydromethanopterin reductase|uniref:5,10-methylenetetrahydromethanopterin reductase n=1 Tax=Mycobacterium conspicuum TaxID=44010 RepID=A0A1X1T379_9MYCO|nr:LLM class flavin-dependent oxidoreductase [Mycobacterium conspicuum]ORV38756.1 5,10-methylene tetrahydromethanopterin reductase [Mycobacterium conspicuum]BBZ41127.1 5,10-methylenetetrahydromethanopterin reductase [Mycobacterium conspicuum]